MVNVNSFSLKLRIVDVDGQPVPTLVVVGPTEAVDAQAGQTFGVDVSVTNANNGTFRITDAIPRLQAGSSALSSAAASFDAPVGETTGTVALVVRADARIGDESEYLIDLVAEAA